MLKSSGSARAQSLAVKGLHISVVKHSHGKRSDHRQKENQHPDQLQKINDHANELLDLLMRWNKGDAEALQILESQVRKVKIKGTEEEISSYNFKDPRELAFDGAWLRLEVNLICSSTFLKHFTMLKPLGLQREVLSAIAEVSTDVRNAIVQRLKERKALRGSVTVVEQRFTDTSGSIPPADWAVNTLSFLMADLLPSSGTSTLSNLIKMIIHTRWR